MGIKITKKGHLFITVSHDIYSSNGNLPGIYRRASVAPGLTAEVWRTTWILAFRSQIELLGRVKIECTYNYVFMHIYMKRLFSKT